MFERFTDRARRALVLAQEETRLLGHESLAPEHLLIGLRRTEEGIAADALGEFGVEVDALRAKTLELAPSGPGWPGRSPPFSPEAKRAMELSLREALKLGHNWIGVEHVLLALLREGEGPGAEVLVALDVDLRALRSRVLELVAASTSRDPITRRARESVTLDEFAGPVDAPRCERCSKPLEGNIAYQVLHAGDEDDETGLSVTVVFCRSCGRSLGALNL